MLNETQRLHRDELMRAAAQARLAHLATPAQASRLDRCLAAGGRTLVRLGRRLEMRVAIGLDGAQP
jgi:hypothetical protein